MSKRKKKRARMAKKRALSIVVIGIVMLVFALFVYANFQVKGEKILNNISVQRVDLSNMTKDQARQKLSEEFSFGKLVLKDDQNSYEYDLKAQGFEYDIDRAVEEAYKVGRSGNFLDNISDVFKQRTGQKIDLKLSYNGNNENLESWINEIAQATSTQPVNPTVSVTGAGLTVIAGSNGKIVDVDSLMDTSKKSIETSFDGQDIVIDIPINTVEPYVKEEQLYQINGIIAQYSTKYPISDKARALNVAVAAKKVNGQLLMPGEEASFMTRLGPVNESAGFKAATVIINNEYVDGIGGGVCQVSSTMYNALIRSGMDVTSRTNHTFPIGYVPLGLDATVADPLPDLKYKNSYAFPVYITNVAGGGYMTTTIYGNKEQSKRVEITTEVIETTPPEVKYKNDPTMPLGKEKVEDQGHTGYKVVSYRTMDGKKTLLSRSNYKMAPKIILTGTGDEVTSPDVTQNDSQAQQATEAPLF